MARQLGPFRGWLVISLCALLLAGSAAAYGCLDRGPDVQAPSRASLTGSERGLLFQAEQILLRDCLRERGFSYSVAKEKPVPEAREFPYGIDDTRWARSHGYGTDISRKMAQIKKEDPNQRYFRSLSAQRRQAALVAVNGADDAQQLTAKTPSGAVLTRSSQGCRTASQATLYGNAAAWFQARASKDDLDAIRVRRVLADPAYRRALRPWSACMRTAGHPYSSPEKARVSMTSSPGTVSAEDERKTATAEARCGRSSGLAGVARRLDARLGRSLRLKYADVVATVTALQVQALPRAYRITGAARP